MNTKLIYVIVSDDTDTYLEQALISAYSARKHNQDAHIAIVIDNLTAKTIIGKREEINNYINEKIIINIPGDHSKTYRSRFIKTNLRNYIEGDYLFIDTDTIICDKLHDIDNVKWEICAVRELNKYNIFSNEEPWMYHLAEKVGIEKELCGEPYFNSGVMYVKDTESTHNLYNKWHQYWQEYTQKGLHTDQTPLCMANKIEGHPIHLLDDTWNCQIKYEGINNAYSAKIVHYFYGMDENEFLFSMHSVLKTIKETGFIPYFIKDIVLHPNKAYMIDAKSMAYIREQGDIRRVYEESKCFFFILQKIGHIYLAFKRRYNFLNKH